MCLYFSGALLIQSLEPWYFQVIFCRT